MAKGTQSILQMLIAIPSVGKTLDPRTTEYLGDLDTMQILETRDGQAGYWDFFLKIKSQKSDCGVGGWEGGGVEGRSTFTVSLKENVFWRTPISTNKNMDALYILIMKLLQV